jgi:hypothetical protein
VQIDPESPNAQEDIPMEANEASELQEHAEHGAHESVLRPVAFTMSLLAVLVAVSTVLGHRTHTEAVLNQTKASVEQNRAADQWADYQAHKIRANDTALASDLLSVLPLADKEKAAKLAKGYADHGEKWDKDLKDLEASAREEEQKVHEYEREVNRAEAKAVCFDLAEALLEIGLVITSVTLLTRSRIYWYFGMVFAVAGIVSGAAAFLVH